MTRKRTPQEVAEDLATTAVGLDDNDDLLMEGAATIRELLAQLADVEQLRAEHALAYPKVGEESGLQIRVNEITRGPADWIKATTQRNQLRDQLATEKPIPILLVCPCCKARHIDEGEFNTIGKR